MGGRHALVLARFVGEVDDPYPLRGYRTILLVESRDSQIIHVGKTLFSMINAPSSRKLPSSRQTNSVLNAFRLQDGDLSFT